jgi:hypothetical protein
MGVEEPISGTSIKLHHFRISQMSSEGGEEVLEIRGASRENFAPAKPPPRRLVAGDLPHKSETCE